MQSADSSRGSNPLGCRAGLTVRGSRMNKGYAVLTSGRGGRGDTEGVHDVWSYSNDEGGRDQVVWVKEGETGDRLFAVESR